MKDYSEYSDEELIVRINDGEKEIIDYIIQKYKDLVRMKAKSMYILGGDHEDTIQEGTIGLFKAIRDYDPGRDASFKTFAEICISRQIFTAIQSSKRLKHAPLNSYVSLYANSAADQTGEEMGDEMQLIAAVSENAGSSPEDIVLNQERIRQLENFMEEELSSLEKQVLELYFTGMNYTEIARILGRDEKSTDNALQRAKSKIKKEMEKW